MLVYWAQLLSPCQGLMMKISTWLEEDNTRSSTLVGGLEFGGIAYRATKVNQKKGKCLERE